jgi:hypothetical protein
MCAMPSGRVPAAHVPRPEHAVPLAPAGHGTSHASPMAPSHAQTGAPPAPRRHRPLPEQLPPLATGEFE